ncbi:MAG: amino acid permease [Bacteroidales bacterium]|nr:amino acid permease [Bacteroidales bacterium]
MTSSNKFGTFGGVFTPSILTILGVIMYMRLPMIIGESGLYATIGIIIVAHIISITTGLSVSSIATDKKVQAGGTYYMISRSLGLPIGGTLGLALFVGLSFSVSLYLIGFSESFLNFWGFELTKDNIRIAGSAILLLVTIITFISTSLALKTQYFIMAAIVLSLLSIFFGKHEFAPEHPFLTNSNATIPIMVLFGIFFPAVTGFEAGVSMSGDLKDPKKSIPLGSISAIMVGLIVYIGLAFYFSYTVDHKALAGDPKILLKIAWIPELVIAGIWGATLSSALGSILGAPRILQATATDRITHRFFARGTGKTNEPRNALLLTFIIAEAGILIGELDVIARIVSIFFITTYGFLNLSCAFERLTSADFRPAFKTPAWISIIGSIACMIVMIQLDFVAMLGATFILGAVYLYIKRKELVLQSGDAWSSLWASLVKSGLQKLKTDSLHYRNWRPNIIMFSGEETDRPYMTMLGKDISGKLGILTGFQLEETQNEILPRKQGIIEKKKENSGYFKNYHACRDIYTGMDEIMRLYGFSGIEPNTILMGWSRDKNKKQTFTDLIKHLEKNNFNSVFLKYDAQRGMGKNKTIDIWWSGWGNNLSFAINLIRHLTTSPNWTNPEIRLFVVVNDSIMIDNIYNSLENILSEYRVNMEIKVINNSIDQLPKNQIIWRESGNTDLTIVGIPDKKFHEINTTYEEVTELTAKMGTMLLINASNNFEDYNIIGDEQVTKMENTIKTETIKLPPLNTTKYPFLNVKLEQFDSDGLKILDTFYKKAFLPFFSEQSALMQKLEALALSAYKELNKTSQIKDKNKTAKIISKIRYDIYIKVKNLIDEFITERIEFQKNVLASGIDWYCNQLSENILSIQKKLSVKYDKSVFNIRLSDSRKLRWFKRKNRLIRPFAKKTINSHINFRKIVRLYLEQNRQQYLHDFLKEINISGLKFISSINDWLVLLDTQMEFFTKEITRGNIDLLLVENKQSELLEKITHINRNVTQNTHYFKNEILTDFRKNIQLLSNDLEKIDINKLISKKKRRNSYYREMEEKNRSFPGEWYDNIYYISNKLLLDLVILNLKNKVRHESSELLRNITQVINSELLTKLEKFRSNLMSVKDQIDNNTMIPELNINSAFLNVNEFTELLSKNLVDVIEEIPEEIRIYSTPFSSVHDISAHDSEVIEIPVRRMVRHFIDSRLIGQLDENLEKMGHEVRKLTYQVKDHLSYLHFELENITPTDEGKKQAIREIIDESLEELKEDRSKIKKLSADLQHIINVNLDNTFEPLSSYKITVSSKELTHIIREYQGKKTKSRFDKWMENIKIFFRKKTVRLLYSQSEGILLARELSEQESGNSPSEIFLNLIDKVSPNPNVYENIPSYYKNLFSGRSSISEDFWIDRKEEEQQFNTAIFHYNNGYRGGILITGERNSGKTAFCRHVTRKYFQTNQVYHIFPPIMGSADIHEFEHELNNVLEIHGNAYEVFEKLPYKKVIVFHDLELWWESTENGFAVLRLILDLIKKFSDKCLILANINSFAYQRINEIQHLADSFISVISCKPFDSEELKDLIMRRHHSGGMKFNLGKKHEDGISEIRLAGLFNKYFNYSKGNPGTALYAWVSHITASSDDQLEIVSPEKPNTSVFENMHDDWHVVLYQIILHKRMTVSKIKRVLMLDERKIMRITDALFLAGLIKEKSSGVYVINPYMDNFVTEYLLENQ